MKKFKKYLPEAIIPDEQLRYILNYVLQYAVASTPPNGNIEFLTKFFILKREVSEAQAFLERYERYIEILVSFTGYRKPMERKDEALDLMLQLVKAMVLRNRGVIKFETDEKEAKTIISLGFPVERRKVVYYEPIIL